jgi:preprotein translocase subunit YajC
MPGQLVFFALLFGAMYMLMVRPQQQRARRQRELISSISVGDQVITAGGMIGEVVGVQDDRVTIRLGPGVDVTFLRGAITQKLVDQPGGDQFDDEVVDLDGFDSEREPAPEEPAAPPSLPPAAPPAAPPSDLPDEPPAPSGPGGPNL